MLVDGVDQFLMKKEKEYLIHFEIEFNPLKLERKEVKV